MDLGFEIEKTNAGTRISNLEVTWEQFSGKIDKYGFFGPNLAKNKFLVRN